MKNLGLLSGILGLTGVALGAFGAHALKDSLLMRGTLDAWETGVRYHLLHAVAVLALAAWSARSRGSAGAEPAPGDSLGFAGKCFAVGVLLFSGSLYGYALGGPHFLVFVTPFGGITLLVGWTVLIWHFRPGNKNI